LPGNDSDRAAQPDCHPLPGTVSWRTIWPTDRIDRAVIEQRRLDARPTNTELADRAGRTPAPCLRRLAQSGVITGYHARLDPARLGRGFEVFVNVDLAVQDRATVAGFEQRVAACPEVVEFRRMFGLPDYLPRVATADLVAFEAFVTNQPEAP
jgi:DNA-binding Lrp family transcriptional regulator